MSLSFRYTTPTSQRSTIEGFSSTETENRQKISRILLYPYFDLVNDQIPNLVTPGGYKTPGSENFEASFYSTTLILQPGYIIIDEMLVEFTNEIVIDLSNSMHYFDSYMILPSSGISGSGASGSNIGHVYCVAYYNPLGEGSSGYSGYSGPSPLSVKFKDPNAVYIGLITRSSTFINYFRNYCFLYDIVVSVSNYKAIRIEEVNYNSSTLLLKRTIPNYLI